MNPEVSNIPEAVDIMPATPRHYGRVALSHAGTLESATLSGQTDGPDGNEDLHKAQ